MLKRKFGWIKDKVDTRDRRFRNLLTDLLVRRGVQLPPEFSLRPQMPPVYDQGELGSCTANGGGAAHQFCQMKQPGGKDFLPSRLFLYYNTRKIEGTAEEDSGCTIRDTFKSLNQYGVCPEADWPYDVAKFADQPSFDAYTAATGCRSIKYARVDQEEQVVKAVLASGFPIVFGFRVPSSFQQIDGSGIMRMPRWWERSLGGHCVVAIGYKQINGVWYIECRNSWGSRWGDQGHFWMPFAFFLNPARCSDLWVLELVQE